MVSDQEIIATVLKHLALIAKGERSIESAGADCFRELMAKSVNADIQRDLDRALGQGPFN